MLDLFVKFSEVVYETYRAVFLWYEEAWCCPLAVVNLLENAYLTQPIDLDTKCSLVYSRYWKWFGVIRFNVLFEFNVVFLTFKPAKRSVEQAFVFS